MKININKENMWHIIWIVGIYAVLVLILYLVVLYKVRWEDRDLGRHLYFYECSHELCTTDKEITEFYSSISCKNDHCPMITEKKDNMVILSDNDKSYVYDYVLDKVINDTYENYKFTNDNALIATDREGKQGIINYDGEVIVDFKYQEIADYQKDFIAFKEQEKYGIDNLKDDIHIEAKYSRVVLINSSIFAYQDEDNNYYIASYSSLIPISNTIYDYVNAYNDLIVVIKNKQLDILDSNLTSKLLMKIDTYYEYTTIKEIQTLNLYLKNNFIHFTIRLNGNENKNYTYDIRNEKLYS